MGVYRKKPVEIEAVQFDGCQWEDEDTLKPMFEGSFDVLPEWLIDALAKNEREPGAVYTVGVSTDAQLSIVTLEGTMQAVPGDFIIRGTAGEIYPCKPDIFHSIYEGPITFGRTELSGEANG